MSFFFDAFDYQMKATNFLDKLQIEGEQKRIRQLEEFKSKFYTNLTHEFRTPLTLIIGMAREVAENPARWVKEGTDTIKHHADSLLQLINQMLDLAKLEAGQVRYDITDVEVRKTLERVEELIIPQVKAKNLQYDITYCGLCSR